MNQKQTRIALILAAIATLALIWFAPKDEGISTSEPAKPAGMQRQSTSSAAVSASASASATGSGVPVLSGSRETVHGSRSLFAAGSWFVPPPPPKATPAPPPPPPPPPQAPSVPFTYLGKYIEDSVTQIILSKGNRVITAKVGETIDTNYHVDRIDANAIVLTYIPMGKVQTIPTGNQ